MLHHHTLHRRTQLRTLRGPCPRLLDAELSRTGGLLRLAPAWVRRPRSRPGFRLKLHPDDVAPGEVDSGGVCERWLASTRFATGKGVFPGMGLSRCVIGDRLISLGLAVRTAGPALVGDAIWRRHRSWPVLAALVDYQEAPAMHFHRAAAPGPGAELAAEFEAHFFPIQLNLAAPQPRPGRFGLALGDGGGTWLAGSAHHRGRTESLLQAPGEGYWFDPGWLHAAAPFCAYVVRSLPADTDDAGWSRPPRADRGAVPRPGRGARWMAGDLAARADDGGAAGQDEDLRRRLGCVPSDAPGTREHGYLDRAVLFNPRPGPQPFAVKELTVGPGVLCSLRDPGAYSLICLQGSGRINGERVASPGLLRLDDLAEDEFFVSAPGAAAGVTFENLSETEPLVLLRCFGPEESSGCAA